MAVTLNGDHAGAGTGEGVSIYALGMLPILSRDAMRRLDEHILGECGVPGILLMENAGRGAAEWIRRRFLGDTANKHFVLVIAGLGNNGGDAFVVARHLQTGGSEVAVLLAGEADALQGDAEAQYRAWIGVGNQVTPLVGEDPLAPLRALLPRAHVIVDGLFGTGLVRPITGTWLKLVELVNDAPAWRVALDMPSGLHADTGMSLGTSILADLTVTFGHPKLGLMTPGGAERAGEIAVVDLGVPPSLVSAVPIGARLLERSDLLEWLPRRRPGAHKGSAGHVAVLAGSNGKTGAALMVARAALRAGAGAASILTWPDAFASVEGQAMEAMTDSLSLEDIEGSIDRHVVSKQAVVIGPGFGLDALARQAVLHTLETYQGPCVVDADALTLVAREGTPAFSSACVLTPHPGEMGRLLGTSAAVVEADRFSAVRDLVARVHAVVVLKGARTIIGSPEGEMVVSNSGTPALATAGSGDVLSGLIASLACGMTPFRAACAGVYLHGLSAEAWSERHGDRGLLASEIADGIPAVIRTLLESKHREALAVRAEAPRR